MYSLFQWVSGQSSDVPTTLVNEKQQLSADVPTTTPDEKKQSTHRRGEALNILFGVSTVELQKKLQLKQQQCHEKKIQRIAAKAKKMVITEKKVDDKKKKKIMNKKKQNVKQNVQVASTWVSPSHIDYKGHALVPLRWYRRSENTIIRAVPHYLVAKHEQVACNVYINDPLEEWVVVVSKVLSKDIECYDRLPEQKQSNNDSKPKKEIAHAVGKINTLLDDTLKMFQQKLIEKNMAQSQTKTEETKSKPKVVETTRDYNHFQVVEELKTHLNKRAEELKKNAMSNKRNDLLKLWDRYQSAKKNLFDQMKLSAMDEPNSAFAASLAYDNLKKEIAVQLPVLKQMFIAQLYDLKAGDDFFHGVIDFDGACRLTQCRIIDIDSNGKKSFIKLEENKSKQIFLLAFFCEYNEITKVGTSNLFALQQHEYRFIELYYAAMGVDLVLHG